MFGTGIQVDEQVDLAPFLLVMIRVDPYPVLCPEEACGRIRLRVQDATEFG